MMVIKKIWTSPLGEIHDPLQNTHYEHLLKEEKQQFTHFLDTCQLLTRVIFIFLNILHLPSTFCLSLARKISSEQKWVVPFLHGGVMAFSGFLKKGENGKYRSSL